ncbi:MAG: hypothetical protein K9K67_00225 [Bacteriovoracaceae bacterium]|nr:hypothetical protein [Bacteriovoracaceae bacterium]
MHNFLIVFLLFNFQVAATDLGKLAKFIKLNENQVRKNYWKHHKEFTKENCRPGTEEEFWTKFRSFRGDGHYLPRATDGKLDRKTLNRFVPELIKKKEWIRSQREQLEKTSDFNELLKELELLEESVEQLIKYKEQYVEATDESAKVSIKNKSKYLFISFKRSFLNFLKKTPFLTSYRYPVDHFELRENYDEVKGGEEKEVKARANEVYFYRKIVQDGAQNPNRSHSDTFLRAMLDTLSLKMKENPEFIPEEIRYDLFSAFYGIEKQLKRGPKKQAKRFQEWFDRVERMLEYYESLKKNRVKVGGHYETGDQIIETQAKARADLKEFVFKKHKEVYDFWSKKEEVYRALYVITTILFNEVGSIDAPYALERQDVSQVVLNRLNNPKYNFIPENDFLYPYLIDEGKKGPLKDYPWLNVLFKEGEFSFTYYFIHGAIRVGCPDMSGAGRKLREKNLEIALERLKEPLGPFKGLRYFSRASMLGRISMDDIWSDYNPISERAGVLLPKVERLKLLGEYRQGNYKYRYHFYDDQGRQFKVVEINDEVYAIETKTQLFHSYRNPHYFKYFEKK